MDTTGSGSALDTPSEQLPSTSSSFSTCRSLFAQHLSQFVQSLDQLDPEARVLNGEDFSAQVTELVAKSFGIENDNPSRSNDQGEPPSTTPVPAWKLDTRRVIVERALDDLVQKAAVYPATEAQQKQLESRLDLLLTFVESGYVDENVPLQTLAGLFELRPISACEPLLGYIETRVDRLTKGMEYQRGRGPILLRLLNDLLRRLPRSKAGPVILSGRILMLLSSVYPLGEKSGVNLRGNFNTGKGTVWEEEEEQAKDDAEKESNDEREEGAQGKEKGEKKAERMEVEEGEEAEEKNKTLASSFYPTFWSLQKYFNNPHLLFGPAPNTTSTSKASTSSSMPSTAPIATLHSSLLTVLTAFAAETKKEKELSGSATTGAAGKGKAVENLASVESMVMGEKDDLDKTEQSLEQYFFPKFLTSKNLLSLELADPTFRLQILVQTLILSQYLLSLTPSARSRAQALPLTNTSAFPSFVLSAEDETKVQEIETKSWKEIENMQGGNKVKRAIQGVLQRERNWTDWKLRSCLPFTKPSLEIATVSKTVSTKLQNMGRPPPRFPYRMGNARLSRVWMKDLKSLDGFEPDVADDEFDSIVREWRMTKKKLEMTRKQLAQIGTSHPKSSELQSSIEPMTIKLQALHFRALRSASTRYLRHFSKIGSGDLEKLLEEIEQERTQKQEEEEAKEAAETRDKTEPDVTTEVQDQGESPRKEQDGKGEEKVAAIRLGDTPVRNEALEAEEMKESGTPPKMTALPTTTDLPPQEPGTPKRPREEDPAEGNGDTDMQDVKKQKV